MKKKPIKYSHSENPLEFYIAEETASYGHKKPFMEETRKKRGSGLHIAQVRNR